MDFTFTPEQMDLQARARALTESHLFPYEEEVQETNALSDASRAAIRDAVLAAGFNAVNHLREDGGQEFPLVNQCLVFEEFGKATNMLGLSPWMPAYCLRFGTQEQKEQYLRPAIRGDLREAFLVTEPQSGSDAGGILTNAVKDGDHYVINGLKCFASGSERADYMLLHCNVDGDPKKATLFLLDKGMDGFKIVKTPRALYNGPGDHPWVKLTNLRVHESKVLGGIGQGFELTKDWFVEQRANIAARCVGVAVRCAEIAADWAAEREAFGRKIQDYQGIEWKLADMAVEIMAAKALLYRCASEYDNGLDRKAAHARMSAVKLFCTEMAWRICDQSLQIQGGHGFMMDNPVARHYTSVRAERIVEGTSEIQKVIIGGQIKKRGMGVYTGLMTQPNMPGGNT
ncbi:MAG: acyl-CoA dehydrogenase family protein [Alphaproteobacteria bacterium]